MKLVDKSLPAYFQIIIHFVTFSGRVDSVDAFDHHRPIYA